MASSRGKGLALAVATPHERGSGQAIQIVTIKFLPNRPAILTLEKSVLSSILRDVGDLPLHIITVCGASRQGKSFLLTVILSILERLASGESSTSSWDDVQSRDSLTGFPFRNGVAPETLGIMMWSTPFILQKSDGSKIAVLLIDTQGVFDSATTKRDWSMIVGLSLLTSSCFIYNLFNNLQEDTLEVLHNFVEFGMLSLEKDPEASSAFQKLIFLIRDWQMPDDHNYGWIGGQAFFKSKFEIQPGRQMSKEAINVRESLKTCFEETSCFLMPYPGEDIKRKKFEGRLQGLESVFLENLQEFVNHLLLTDEMAPAKIGNQELTGSDLPMYFEKYIQLFNEQHIPTAISYLEATEEAKLETISGKCCQIAEEKINEILQNGFVSMKLYKPKCDQFGKEALALFGAESKDRNVSNSSLIPKHRGLLANKLKELFTQSYASHEAAKKEFIEKSATKYVGSFIKTVQSRLKDDIYLATDLQSILDHEIQSVLTLLTQECETHEDAINLLNNAKAKISPLLQEIASNFVESNSEKVQRIQPTIATVSKSLIGKYDEKMDDFVDVLKINQGSTARSKEKLITFHKKCEEKVGSKFLLSLSTITNDNLRAHFVTTFQTEISTRFAHHAQKAFAEDDTFTQKVDTVYGSIMEKYSQAIVAFMTTSHPEPSLSELTAYHESLELNIENKLRREFDKEEANKLVEQFTKDSHQFRQTLIESRQHEKANFQSCLNSALAQGVEVYAQEVWQIVGGQDKLISESELRRAHEQFVQTLGQKLVDQDWVLKEELPKLKETVKASLEGPLTEAMALLQINIEQAVFQMDTVSSQIISQFGSNLLTARSKDGNIDMDKLSQWMIYLQEEALDELRQTPAFPKLPEKEQKSLLQKLTRQLKQSADEFSITLHLQTTQQKAILDSIIDSCFQYYETEKEALMITITGPPDPALLQKMHKICLNKTKMQLTNQLQASNITSHQTQKDMLERLGPSLEDAFSKLLNKAEQDLQKVTESIQDLMNGVIKHYKEKISEFIPVCKTEEELSHGHAQIAQEILKNFDTSFPLPDLARFREEKRQLESNLQTLLEEGRRQLLENCDQHEKETKGAVLEIVEKYKAHVEGQFQKDSYMTPDQVEEVLKTGCRMAQQEFESLQTPPSVKKSVFENLLHHNIEETSTYLRTQSEAVRQSILDKIKQNVDQQWKLDFLEVLTPVNDIDNCFLDLKQEFIVEAKKALQNKFSIPCPALATIVTPLLEDAISSARADWEATQPSNLELDLALSKAKDEYLSGMDKHYKNTKKFTPMKELEKVHKGIADHVRGNFRKAVRQTKNVKKIFEEMQFELFRKYVDDNKLKAADEMDKAIGIDLGTTYSCVAAYVGGTVKMIPDRNSHNNLTPSYVLFHPSSPDPVVGDSAKDQAEIYCTQTIFDAKRLIGRKFTDQITQKDMKTWPFKVDSDAKGRPRLSVGNKKYYPEEISAKILAKLKDDAEKYFDCEIKNAIITVPAYFTDAQKTATKNAGNIAGLNVMGIVNEPTAAAIAYSLNYTDNLSRNILVYDLGGGTFDVSILTVKGGSINVQVVAGDNHLGGEDFDTNMLNYCVQEFYRIQGIQLDKDGREEDRNSRIRRIRSKCEKAKKNLSVGTTAKIVVDGIYQNLNLEIDITREKFNELNEPLFQKTITIVRKALSDAKLVDIDEVVLVGGSTRIPRVQELLAAVFPTKRLNMTLNPDEVVAQGAALLAALKNGASHGELGKISFTDVTPISLGTDVQGGYFSIIIPRNSKVPCTFTQPYLTAAHHQTTMDISIYEGEYTYATNNNLLGKFLLTGIPPRPAGREKVEVTISCNSEGILDVNAVCLSNQISGNIKIEAQKSGLSETEVSLLRSQ